MRKKVIATLRNPVLWQPGMTCSQYFSDLPEKSPQRFMLQFVKKNTGIPKEMEAIRICPNLQENKAKILQDLRNGLPSINFVNPKADSVVLYLFLVDKVIEAETCIQACTFINALRHCRKVSTPSDRAGRMLPQFKNSRVDVIDIRCKSQNGIINQLGCDLKLEESQVRHVLENAQPEYRMAFTIITPVDTCTDAFRAMTTGGMTFLNKTINDNGVEKKVTLHLHPHVIKQLVRLVVPLAQNIEMAPVLGTYGWSSALTLLKESVYHPVGIWSPLIQSNYQVAHEYIPAGILNTAHDICHLLVKMILPEPFRNHLIAIASDPEHCDFNSLSCTNMIDLAFFESVMAVNFEILDQNEREALISVFKTRAQYYRDLSPLKKLAFRFMQYELNDINSEYLLTMPTAQRLNLTLYSQILGFAEDLSLEECLHILKL